jgi:hypothetical protein
VTKLHLSAERLREVLRYEPDTGEFFRTNGKLVGTTDKQTYIRIRIDGTNYKAHRLAWLYVFGEWPIKLIDHINGIPSDNRLANLRDVTHSVNLQNQKRSRRNSQTQVLGVTVHQNKYQARVNIDGKSIYLGVFTTPELAHDAYLEAKRKHHAGCTI